MARKIAPPEYLRPETAAWFRGVCRDFVLEPHHLRLLALAAENWDRGQAAREIIAEKGLTFPDRFGAPKARPEVKIATDCAVVFARILRELALDIEPPPEARLPRHGARSR